MPTTCLIDSSLLDTDLKYTQEGNFVQANKYVNAVFTELIYNRFLLQETLACQATTSFEDMDSLADDANSEQKVDSVDQDCL